MKPTHAASIALSAFCALALPAFAHADTTSTLARMRLDAHGRTTGLILSDGTELVTSPAQSDLLLQQTHLGDRILVSTGPRNTQDLVDLTSGHFLNLGSTDVLARGGGPAAPAQPYTPIDNARSLTPMRSDGQVATMLHTPNGDCSGFVMTDGTQVHMVPNVDGVLADVHPGDRLTVEGRGTINTSGNALWATYVARGRRVLLDMSRGPIGAPELGL